MKKLFLIPLAFSLSFCKCNQSSMAKSTISSIESACPENGKCSIEIIKNKSLDVKTDEFGGIYYTLNDDVAKSVIHYQYNRNVEEGLQDGQHREEIVFEISNSESEIRLSDGMLQSSKMLFGRHCFCRGQAGFFKVEQGVLNLSNKAGVVKVDLDFKITKVPQLFTKVKAIL